jgi:tRNA modification GTPase
MKFSDGPIITCSSGIESPSAIAIIRITGFSNLSLFQPLLQLNLNNIKPRFAHFCQIVSEAKVLDDIILLFFPAPNSFTGENLLELHVHGNPLHVSKLISLFSSVLSIREAFAGEFTFRAYRNKKLSLSQVEGLDMLLHAKTPLALDQGVQLLNGSLHKLYHRLYELHLDLKTSIELLIDFSEDVGEDIVRQRYSVALKEFLETCNVLHARVGNFADSLLNPQVVLLGPVNAGKSTLFNLLLGQNRSIVSSTQGTTRDYISDGFVFNDVHFRFIDTAGIRETDDDIERQGISLGLNLANDAFFKIGVFNLQDFDDLSLSGFPSSNFDLIVLTHGEGFTGEFPKVQSGIPYIISSLTQNLVYYFAPIEPVSDSAPIEPVSDSAPIEPFSNSAPIGPVSNSAPIGPVSNNAPIGADNLIKQLVFNKYSALSSSQPLLLRRHRECINRLMFTINSIGSEIHSLDDLAISSSNLQRVSACLTDLVGILPPDELLNNIFEQFCIGK